MNPLTIGDTISRPHTGSIARGTGIILSSRLYRHHAQTNRDYTNRQRAIALRSTLGAHLEHVVIVPACRIVSTVVPLHCLCRSSGSCNSTVHAIFVSRGPQSNDFYHLRFMSGADCPRGSIGNLGTSRRMGRGFESRCSHTYETSSLTMPKSGERSYRGYTTLDFMVDKRNEPFVYREALKTTAPISPDLSQRERCREYRGEALPVFLGKSKQTLQWHFFSALGLAPARRVLTFSVCDGCVSHTNSSRSSSDSKTVCARPRCTQLMSCYDVFA